MNGSGSAARAPLHGGIVEKLRSMIITCEFKPGERLPESHVMQTLSVSRTPLREALKLLAAEGLVEIRPHKGAIIAGISKDEISQTFDLIQTLEVMAGPLVCERVSNRDIANLESIVGEMTLLHEKRDLKGYFYQNKLFHNQIISLSGNKVLTTVYADLYDKVQRVRFLVNDNPERWQASSKEHLGIMAALGGRDGEALGRTLKEHSLQTSRAIMKQLEKLA